MTVKEIEIQWNDKLEKVTLRTLTARERNNCIRNSVKNFDSKTSKFDMDFMGLAEQRLFASIINAPFPHGSLDEMLNSISGELFDVLTSKVDELNEPSAELKKN